MREHGLTKVRVAISEAGGECVCWFPSAAQNAADSDSIKNRFYGHRILQYVYGTNVHVFILYFSTLVCGEKPVKRVKWIREGLLCRVQCEKRCEVL